MKKLLFALSVSASYILIGCSTFQKLTPSYQHAQERAQTLEQLQLTTMRFSDEYCTRVVEGVNRFQADVRVPEERLLAMQKHST